MTHMFVT